jgi:transcription initiation factor TFIIF subunit alpha
VERQREEERKKEEEAKAKQDPKLKTKDASSTKPPSGASSRGANTPSGRKEKHSDLRVKAIKRPGSPGLSEASGNESSRVKRMKLKPSGGTATPRPDAVRQGTNPSRQGSFLGTAGSGSDTDARATNPRIKLTLSQRGSRAGSPAVSRAQSPPARSPNATPAAGGFPTAAEIAAAVPKEGITIKALLQVFDGRFSKARSGDFIAEVKKITKLHPTVKSLLVPKNAGTPVPAPAVG